MYSSHIQNLNYLAGNSSHNMTVTENSSLFISEPRKKSEMEFDKYLQETGKKSETNSLNNTNNKKITILLARNTLISVSKLNKQVKHINSQLKNNIGLSKLEWDKKINEYKAIKSKIFVLMNTFKDDLSMKGIKQYIEKRRKKRLREKLKQIKGKNEKFLRVAKRERLHALIDHWIIHKQTIIEQEKQKEMLRKDADVILSDVRGKRSDARKYLGLLQQLQILRNIKTNIAQARGQHLSLAADKVFYNIIEKLMEQWKSLDMQYSVEEKGLKLMLKTDSENKIKKHEKNIFDDWENVLFGRKLWTYMQYHEDINLFVLFRSVWDTFLSADIDASPIPVGWIVPEKPSSMIWQKCLQSDKNK